jgi:transcriptional regulator with XRE-family HTH domain
MAIHRQLAICRRIRMLREQQGLTQFQVADQLGMSQAAYSRLESGSSDLTVHRAMQLADLFKLPFEKLLQGL